MFSALLPILFAAAEIDLSGDWLLSGMNETGAAIECPIAVPGGVHHALYKANLIENPFWGCNETNVQWVGRRDTPWGQSPKTVSKDYIFRYIILSYFR